MGLEAPVGGAVHAGGGERGEAQLVLAGGDVLGHLLQIVKALDIVGGVAGLLQQGLVVDDAVGLNDVADARHLVPVHQGELVAGQLAGHGGAGQVIAVVLPAGQAHGTVDLEQGGGVGLGHLGLQGGLVVAGGGGEHSDLHAGLLSVQLGQLLPLGVLLGFEVQVVDLPGGLTIVSGRGGVSPAGTQERQGHDGCQRKSKDPFFHYH